MSVSGQVKDHVVPTCTNAVLQMWLWPATDREPHCRHLLPLTTFEGGLNLLHEAHDDAVIYGWNLQRLQHSRSNKSSIETARNCSVITSRFAIRYDTRCYFNVRSKANMSQLNLPHGTDN